MFISVLSTDFFILLWRAMWAKSVGTELHAKHFAEAHSRSGCGPSAKCVAIYWWQCTDKQYCMDRKGYQSSFWVIKSSPSLLPNPITSSLKWSNFSLKVIIFSSVSTRGLFQNLLWLRYAQVHTLLCKYIFWPWSTSTSLSVVLPEFIGSCHCQLYCCFLRRSRCVFTRHPSSGVGDILPASELLFPKHRGPELCEVSAEISLWLFLKHLNFPLSLS